MGLDMYLASLPRIDGMELKQLYLVDRNLAKWKEEGNELYQKVKGFVRHYEEFGREWDSIVTEIAYWRKANWLHHWFVTNVQEGNDDMFSYEVKRHHIAILYNNCEMILLNKVKPYDALPTMPGPYWGSTSYDFYYFHEIERSYTIFENLLKQPSFFDENILLYQASW
ncbi:hypothetical protein [Litchfieldia alkalitelluris]|uniref:hypothetical protein n=1 Tax=Litchfieldia alkalitelluris TaxID=304268 RepID=UPI0009978B7A|nr:hypothetical protein [Litchfieldia alkalitelluris]